MYRFAIQHNTYHASFVQLCRTHDCPIVVHQCSACFIDTSASCGAVARPHSVAIGN